MLPGTTLVNPNPPSQTLGPALSTVRVAGSAVHSDPTQRCFENGSNPVDAALVLGFVLGHAKVIMLRGLSINVKLGVNRW